MSHESSPPAQAPSAIRDGDFPAASATDPMLYRQAFDAAGAALLIADAATGTVIAANRLLAQLASRSEALLRGQPLESLALFGERTGLATTCLTLPAGTSLRGGDRLHVPTPDGAVRSLEFTATAFLSGERRLVCCRFDDVTAAEIRERRTRQAHKMEAVRLLASATAHDFNNVLSCIRGYVSIALETAGVAGEIRDILTRVKDVSLRAGELPQRLLDFSRQRKLTLHSVDLREFVRRAGAELQAGLPPGVAFRVRISEDPVQIAGDETALRLALTLLMRNAREAVGEHGEIVLEAARWNIPAPLHGGRTAAETYARLSLRDSGCGMSAETQERLFEPGFTTKKSGRASAMSLSTVYRIAVQHGGWAEVDSAVGRGSSFALILPLEAPAAS